MMEKGASVRVVRLLLVASMAALAAGCALFGGARVEPVATSVQKPSNVALYLEVTEGGEPVTGLEPKNFRIHENEQELRPDDVKRTLLDRAPVTTERVVLLVELGGAPASPERTLLVKAVSGFVEKLRDDFSVSVFAFDGGSSLRLVGEAPRGTSADPSSALAGLPAPDGSRNLHGAVVDGVRQLELRLSGDEKPVRLGTLVVFARGPDLANRVEMNRMHEVLASVRFDVIGVGIGEDTSQLGFARSGLVRAQAADTIPIAFEEAASRVRATHGKYYLVSYCSPARAGERRVRVEVAYTTKTGDERSGSATHDFDATGFGPGCDPDTTPRFVPRARPAAGDTSATEPTRAPEHASPEAAPPAGGADAP